MPHVRRKVQEHSRLDPQEQETPKVHSRTLDKETGDQSFGVNLRPTWTDLTLRRKIEGHHPRNLETEKDRLGRRNPSEHHRSLGRMAQPSLQRSRHQNSKMDKNHSENLVPSPHLLRRKRRRNLRSSLHSRQNNKRDRNDTDRSKVKSHSTEGRVNLKA